MGLCASANKSTTVHPAAPAGGTQTPVEPSGERLVYKEIEEEKSSTPSSAKGSSMRLSRAGSFRMRAQYEEAREKQKASRRSTGKSSQHLSSTEIEDLGSEYTAEARERVRKAFHDNPIFKHLSDEVVNAIYAEMVPLRVKEGILLFREAEDASMFYVVEDGVFASGDAKGNKIDEYKQGDAIGEEALLAQAQRSCHVVALSEGRLWAMDRLKYQQVLMSSSQAQSAQTISSLRNVPLLSSLSKQQLEGLQSAFTKVEYKPGNVIITEGEQGDTFYIIQSGCVKCQSNADQEGKRIRELGPGEFFGEGALLTAKPRSMNVTASGPVTCLTIDKDTFDATLAPLQDILSHNFFVRVLGSIPLFEPLANEELERVSENMVLREYGNNDYIITQGEIGTKMFIVKEGRVKVLRTHDDGNAEEMGVMVSGDYFGEGGFLTGEVRTASCLASGERTVCAILDRDAFGEVLKSLEPALAQQFAARQSLWESPEEEESTILAEDLEVVTRLGQGNFGSVDIVRHRVTGRTYALKKMVKKMIEERNIQKYVGNERYILSRIRCPFIVRLHRTFRTKKHVYFLMDLLSGGELQPRMISKTPLNARATRFYAANVALALIYMHERGVLHRDLKGENVMIHQSGYLKLVDFGMATRLKKGQRAHTMCGTPEFLAPEVLTGGSGVGYGTAVDWWSYGVIVGMMITGGKHPLSIPLQCTLPKAWKVLVKYVERYPEWSSLRMPDADGQDFVTRLLHPNPARRLGAGKRGARGVMKHPFFAGIDWEKLANRNVEPPYKPEVKDLLDVSNFNKNAAEQAQRFDNMGHDNSSVISTIDDSKGNKRWDEAF